MGGDRMVSIVAAAVLLAACKDKPAPAKEAPPPAPADAAVTARATVDLSGAGDAFRGLTVQAPAGATAAADGGAAVVTHGDGFALRIIAGAADLASHKGLVEREHQANKFRTDLEHPYSLAPWVVDAPDELVYQLEWPAGRKQVHFRANARLADRAFTCQDVDGGADKTLAQTREMIAVCRTLAPAATPR